MGIKYTHSNDDDTTFSRVVTVLDLWGETYNYGDWFYDEIHYGLEV